MNYQKKYLFLLAWICTLALETKCWWPGSWVGTKYQQFLDYRAKKADEARKKAQDAYRRKVLPSLYKLVVGYVPKDESRVRGGHRIPCRQDIEGLQSAIDERLHEENRKKIQRHIEWGNYKRRYGLTVDQHYRQVFGKKPNRKRLDLQDMITQISNHLRDNNF